MIYPIKWNLVILRELQYLNQSYFKTLNFFFFLVEPNMGLKPTTLISRLSSGQESNVLPNFQILKYSFSPIFNFPNSSLR